MKERGRELYDESESRQGEELMEPMNDSICLFVPKEGEGRNRKGREKTRQKEN